MNALLLNRDGFQMPADGWYQLAPLGEFPHAGAGVVQVVDVEACTAMTARFQADAAVENFAGLLVDFDHFSLDDRTRSEAAGWMVELEARGPRDEGRGTEEDSTTKVTKNTKGGEAGAGPASPADGATPRQSPAAAGLWAKIRWSDVGEEAVKGGRYRFLSPVWARSDCVDLGNGRVRPVRLLNAAVTNDPNLKGLRPLSNNGRGAGFGDAAENDAHLQQSADKRGSNEGPVDSCAFYRGVHSGLGKEGLTMKRVIEKLMNHLGLTGDATEDAILEKMQGLPAMTAVADVQNSLRDLQGKHDAVVANLKKAEGDLVNRHLAEFEGVISNESREFWAGQLLENRDGALAALGDLVKLRDAGGKVEAGCREPESTRKPLHNRATARPVPPGQGAAQGGEADSKAVKIRNRAHEIAKAEGVAFSTAFRRAEKEVLG
jgi:phage I-like protein